MSRMDLKIFNGEHCKLQCLSKLGELGSVGFSISFTCHDLADRTIPLDLWFVHCMLDK